MKLSKSQAKNRVDEMLKSEKKFTCAACGKECIPAVYDYTFSHEYGNCDDYRVESACCEGDVKEDPL